MALTAVCGGVGWVTDRVAVHAGYEFPSFGYLAGELVWKLATLGVLVWAVRRYDHQRLDARAAGIARGAPDAPRSTYPARLAIGVLVVAIVVNSLYGSSASSTDSFGPTHKAGALLIVAQLLIRYPLTVLVEEAFFRGVLQPRLGPPGPVLAALLWGGYHLQQVPTIPSIVVFGIVLGFIRWRSGNVRATGLIHYVSNAVFFITGYT